MTVSAARVQAVTISDGVLAECYQISHGKSIAFRVETETMAGAHGTESGDEPTRFVCENCHVISVGIPESDDGTPSKHFDQPQQCGACGGSDFVRFVNFDGERERS